MAYMYITKPKQSVVLNVFKRIKGFFLKTNIIFTIHIQILLIRVFIYTTNNHFSRSAGLPLSSDSVLFNPNILVQLRIKCFKYIHLELLQKQLTLYARLLKGNPSWIKSKYFFTSSDNSLIVLMWFVINFARQYSNKCLTIIHCLDKFQSCINLNIMKQYPNYSIIVLGTFKKEMAHNWARIILKVRR